jgi:tripartite-type tricarboxylate transporter receptor subunit TctC
VIVPYAAGGGTDFFARLVFGAMGEQLGQQFVIENRPGAGTNIGAEAAARAEPDGYTLLLGDTATFATNRTLYRKISFDPYKDFSPISLTGRFALVLLVNTNKLPVTSVQEIVAEAKKTPGRINYATPGLGSPFHLATELLSQGTGIKLTHVPYRGAAPAMQDLIGGRIDFVAEQISTALPQIEANTVKAIATLGLDRAPGVEDLPTAQELGLAGLDCGSWASLSFPKGTPDEIVRRLAKATNEAVETPAVRERFKSIGVTIPPPERRTPDYLAKFVPSEIERWAGPIKASGASAD